MIPLFAVIILLIQLQAAAVRKRIADSLETSSLAGLAPQHPAITSTSQSCGRTCERRCLVECCVQATLARSWPCIDAITGKTLTECFNEAAATACGI